MVKKMTKAQFLTAFAKAVANTKMRTAPERCGPQGVGTHFNEIIAAKEWACDLGIFFGSDDFDSYHHDPVVVAIHMFWRISDIFPMSLDHLVCLEIAWEHFESRAKN